MISTTASAPNKTVLSLQNMPPKPSNMSDLTKGVVFTPSRVNPDQPMWPAYRGYHQVSFA